MKIEGMTHEKENYLGSNLQIQNFKDLKFILNLLIAITKYIPYVSTYLFSMEFTTKCINVNLDHGVTMNRSISFSIELPNLAFKSSPFIIVQKP